jgi:hypothetical protein
MCMKNNSKVAMGSTFDLNPLIHICKTIRASWVLTHSFHEYLKFVEMAIIHVIGFTLKNFPYATMFDSWIGVANQYGVLTCMNFL